MPLRPANDGDEGLRQPMNMVFNKPSLVVPDKLSSAEMSRLGQISSWRFCLALAFDVAVIVAAVALSERSFFSPLAYIVSVILIGSRLHAFGILMHDCVHYRAFRSRKLNMIVGELLGWTLLTTATGYRNNHLTHHRHLNTLDDPDFARKVPQRKFHFPMSRSAVVKGLLYQLSGIGILEVFQQTRKSVEMNAVPRQVRLLRLGFYLGVLALCIATGTVSKLALYWLVPMLTSFAVIFYVRSVAEHHGNLAYDHTYTNTRTTIPNAVEGFLLMPHNVGYHLEHHLFPHVPFYRLPELHRLLMEREQYAQKAHVTRGIGGGMLREWIASARGPHIHEIVKQQQSLAGVASERQSMPDDSEWAGAGARRRA